MVKAKQNKKNTRAWIQEAPPVEARIHTRKTAVGMTRKTAVDRSQRKNNHYNGEENSSNIVSKKQQCNQSFTFQ